MTVRELINRLIEGDYLDTEVYIGKGMGPLESITSAMSGDKFWLILTPARSDDPV